ncbi:phosphatase PAP2 family protein [Embleya sp. NBC_00896]|uniref:phosphatase PAP2 family protein n=1 Tax=Embleya sp. NBC_00896 TaxID=2975961 RepID=UPI003864FB53|nr:phosphatase PAP2 family protein [Embleya sp. NBC_00896]
MLLVLTVAVVAESDPLRTLDRTVRDAVRDLAAGPGTAWLDGPAHALADLGGPVPGGIVLAAAALFATRRLRRAYPILVCLGAVAVVMIAVIGGKDLIGRPGPGESPVTADQWGFFPSGHTATSTICYGLAVLLLGRVGSAAARRRWHAGAAVLCALIGFALLWCDYHWLADVVAAWALCGIVLWAAARILDAAGLGARPPASPPSPSPPVIRSSSDR